MTDKDVTSLAMETMCALYRLRAAVIVDVQVQALQGGRTALPIQLYPPQPGEFNIIAAAIATARDAGIHAAMGPIVRECDQWTAKGAKARLEALLDEVRALKSSSLAVAG